jgi:DnaK suppressor protein
VATMTQGLDLDQFRRLLEARRAEVEAESRAGEADREAVALDGQSQGRLSRMDAVQRQAVALDMERRRQAELQRIDLALARIEEDEFGWCASCGELIATKRLELDPAVATCIGCASGA